MLPDIANHVDLHYEAAAAVCEHNGHYWTELLSSDHFHNGHRGSYTYDSTVRRGELHYNGCGPLIRLSRDARHVVLVLYTLQPLGEPTTAEVEAEEEEAEAEAEVVDAEAEAEVVDAEAEAEVVDVFRDVLAAVELEEVVEAWRCEQVAAVAAEEVKELPTHLRSSKSALILAPLAGHVISWDKFSELSPAERQRLSDLLPEIDQPVGSWQAALQSEQLTCSVRLWQELLSVGGFEGGHEEARQVQQWVKVVVAETKEAQGMQAELRKVLREQGSSEALAFEAQMQSIAERTAADTLAPTARKRSAMEAFVAAGVAVAEEAAEEVAAFEAAVATGVGQVEEVEEVEEMEVEAGVGAEWEEVEEVEEVEEGQEMEAEAGAGAGALRSDADQDAEAAAWVAVHLKAKAEAVAVPVAEAEAEAEDRSPPAEGDRVSVLFGDGKWWSGVVASVSRSRGAQVTYDDVPGEEPMTERHNWDDGTTEYMILERASSSRVRSHATPCQNCPACPKLPLHAQNLPSPALPKTATVPNPPPPT